MKRTDKQKKRWKVVRRKHLSTYMEYCPRSKENSHRLYKVLLTLKDKKTGEIDHFIEDGYTSCVNICLPCLTQCVSDAWFPDLDKRPVEEKIQP